MLIKLGPVSVNLCKLSDVGKTDVVKKVYIMLRAKYWRQNNWYY